MGKLIQLIGMLVFIDMMVYLFGTNLASFSLTSMIFLAIKYGSFEFLKNKFSIIFGIISSNLAVGIGVYLATWFGSGNRDTSTWNAVASSLLLNLSADFIVIYRTLSQVYPPLTYYLATIMFVPVIIIYFFILIEWVRGKD